MFKKDELVAGGVTNANGELSLERYVIPAGKYYLKEISAPKGYIISSEKHEIELANEILEKSITIENDYTKLEITKTDITDGKPVVGAKLQILDKDGKEVASWETTEAAHRIDKLPVGEYTLVEIQAPDGYKIAESIKFEVKETPEIQKVEMKDAKEEVKVDEIEKEEPKNEEELETPEETSAISTGDAIVITSIVLVVAVVAFT